MSPLEAGNLTELQRVRHGFWTREGGVSDGVYTSLNCGFGSNDRHAAVAENRARAARHLGAATAGVITPYQVHGAVAITIDGPIAPDAPPRADALVTRTSGLAIGILTADCAPVLMADAEAGVVAAAHAGWRGAAAGIVESGLGAMEQMGASRARIRAAIGPCIGQPAYEVGPEFEAELMRLDPANARFFQRGASQPHFDLPAYVADRLFRAGVGSIERRTLCTYENESRFFSFRRATHRGEPDYGRQISAILLK